MPGLSWERGREREKTRPRERANRPGLSLRACRGGASGGRVPGSWPGGAVWTAEACPTYVCALQPRSPRHSQGCCDGGGCVWGGMNQRVQVPALPPVSPGASGEPPEP